MKFYSDHGPTRALAAVSPSAVLAMSPDAAAAWRRGDRAVIGRLSQLLSRDARMR